jgi:hypothetical protein
MFLADQYTAKLRWRKASHSANDGACVEVAVVNGRIAVRDSKDPGGRQLRYPMQSWRNFTANAVKQERDLFH